MEDKTKLRLTASEMTFLWTQYVNDTATVCVLAHFLATVEDMEVLPVLEYAMESSQKNIATLKTLFQEEKFPIPIGFTEKDVNPDAPKLFSDTYVLMYLRNMSLLGMTASTLAIGNVTRPDTVMFHKNVLKSSVNLQDMARQVMLKQGTYIRPPFISTPDQVDFVERQQFLAGFIGEKRPLTSVEITHLFINVQTNAIGKTLITGFAQIAERAEVKKYLLRGKKIAQKHVDLFSDMLKKNDLPAPMTWDTALTDTTMSIFSDKLIMFHVSAMIAAGVGNYGAAMAASPRRDIGLKYASLIPEISLYAEDGANIMIKNGWLEEPPTADPREKLIKGNK